MITWPFISLLILACIAISAPWLCYYAADTFLKQFGLSNLQQPLQQLLTWVVWFSLLFAAMAIIPVQFIQRIKLRQFGKQLSLIDFGNPSFETKYLKTNRLIEDSFPYLDQILHRLNRSIAREKGLIAELNAASDYTDLLLESVGEAIMVFDSQGKLQDFNAVSEKIFGLSASHHIGRAPVFMALNEKSFYRYLHNVTKEISLNGIYKGEVKLISDQGEIIYAEATMAPVGSYKSLGRELYIAAIRDISARHNALEALEESEQRYRMVTDGSPLGIYIYQDGRLVFVNQRLATILEVPSEELLSGNLYNYLDPSDRQAMRTRTEKSSKALPGGAPLYEMRLITANGDMKWVEIQSASFLINGRPATIGNVQDITERRLARQEARNRLKEIEVLGRISALANRAEDIETMLNQAVSEMNGIIGLQGGCILLKSDYEEAMVLKCQENAPNWLMEYARELTAACKDNQIQDRGIETFPATRMGGPIDLVTCVVPLKSANHPVGYLLMWGENVPDYNTARFINSVSLELGTTVERLRLVQALRLSEGRYRDLFENAGDLIEAVDEQGRYVYVNKRWLDVLGYEEKEVEQLCVKDVVDPNWLKTYMKLIEEVKAGGKIDNAELVYLRKDGGQVKVEGDITTRLRNGKIAYTRSMFRDVTTNRMLQEHMQRAQRIESLAIMAGGMAHDFNNVLMAVLGNISIMLSEFESGSKMHQRLSNIEQQALAGCSVTRQLLNIARTQGPESTQIDIVSMLEGIVEVVRRTRKGLNVDVDVDDEVPGIKGDEGQLHQAFMNLVINAAQATRDGGRVQVRISSERLDSQKAEARSVEKGKYFKVEVSDNGHGIDDSDLKRIFDPFFSTKDRNRGTGLGLTMAYRTIKQHNGFIEVQSQRYKGTTFTVFLPVCGIQQKEQPNSEGAIQDYHDQVRDKIIMVVDDEQSVRQTISEMLQQMGASVLEASDGRQAQQLLESEKQKVDLIVLDMIMPDMDGNEFYQWLETSTHNPMVLFATGNGLHPTIEKNITLGQCSYIAKPFRLGELNIKLAEIFTKS